MLGYGSGMVREPADTDPNSGGGPIRRSPLLTARSGEGMPPNGWPTMVLRTPHQVVYEPEPGGAAWPGITYKKFLPDGRLVDGTALGYAEFGADAPDPQKLFEDAVARAQAALDTLQVWGLIGAGGLAIFVGGLVLGGSQRLRTGLLATGAYVGGVALTRHIVKTRTAAAAQAKFIPSAASGPGHF